MSDYHGHITLEDGTHVALTKDEAEALWKAAEEAKNKAESEMPATADALRTMQNGFSRLRDLGWREAQYCPKDSTPFAVIQYGSTGIFEAWYMGDWPDGRVYCCDYLTHPHGMMYKPLADLTADERDLMNECMGREKAAHDREVASPLNQTEETSS